MKNSKGKFTQHEIDTAIKVLIDSSYVKNWVMGELKAYGVDPNSQAGLDFKKKRSKEIAEKLIM